ncbi:saposin B domain-containing protein [Heterostelium album PN500]|uniref:Saposin B domain-containing protein n=1 Tax=Heterostelium pallidum (strain ATCC 26659 / Pp 5 / PN500) TaxID=670386 RepID=D3B7C7_HETP5|nr:saposin B domain-containing protein [Heterostelium album PN500]EFA82670.1 saposin B domain-containing protein [Heterostelium album PN500]|eukprot:XP_020434787.1 saposin B domain-containing protein [Heterostelium album PN500]
MTIQKSIKMVCRHPKHQKGPLTKDIIFNMKSVAILLFALLAVYSVSAVAVHEQTNVRVEKNGEEGVQCTLCSYIVGKVENAVEKNITEAQIIIDLQNECAIMGALAGECKTLIAVYGPTIIAKVQAAQNPITICTDIGLCSSKVAVKKPVPAVKGGINCDICNYLVGKIESALNLNMNETEIMGLLQNDCSKLGPVASVCDDVVNIYGPTIIQKIQNQENPLTVCTEVGLCTTAVAKPAPKKAVKGDTECAVCNYIVARAEKYIEGNLTVPEIVSALETDCADLGPFASICKTAVSLYGPQIVQQLINEVSPTTICTDIGLCTSAKKVAKPVKNDVECSLCNYLVGKIESYLGLNINETQIVALLDNDCNELGPLASTCQNFVSIYAPQIINSIINDENPITICTDLGVCSSKAAKKSVKGSTECTLCSYLVGRIETYLDKGLTVNQIVTILENDCADIGPLASTCKSIVALYGPAIVQRLISGVSPLAICTDVGLCTSANARPSFTIQAN